MSCSWMTSTEDGGAIDDFSPSGVAESANIAQLGLLCLIWKVNLYYAYA